MSQQTWQLDGHVVPVAHLDKLYWPAAGLTKGDMLDFYRRMAPVLLPYLRDRPVRLRVFPDGVGGFSYFRREPPEHAPEWLLSTIYHPQTSAQAIQVPVIADAAGLIWLANQGGIEVHTWASRLPDLAQPDQAIFDLDPGDEATFAEALRAALRLREALETLDVRGFAKTSGGHGLHVLLPLAPGHTFAAVRAWVKVLAERLADAWPDLIAVAHGATHRDHAVTIDYAQNSIGRNTTAPYTLRAQPGATVSTPLSWEEVADGRLQPSDLTLRDVPERVRRLGDLFAPVLQQGQRLPPLPP